MYLSRYFDFEIQVKVNRPAKPNLCTICTLLNNTDPRATFLPLIVSPMGRVIHLYTQRAPEKLYRVKVVRYGRLTSKLVSMETWKAHMRLPVIFLPM